MSQGDLNQVSEIDSQHSFKCGTFGASTLEERHLATGDFKGVLNTWDLEKGGSPVFTGKYHKEIINCIDGVGGRVGQGSPEIVTGSRDGDVCIWDPRTSEP